MKRNFLESRRNSLGLSQIEMSEKWSKIGIKKSPQAISQYEKFIRYVNISEIRDLQKAYNMTDDEVLCYLDLCREVKYGSENA